MTIMLIKRIYCNLSMVDNEFPIFCQADISPNLLNAYYPLRIIDIQLKGGLNK